MHACVCYNVRSGIKLFHRRRINRWILHETILLIEILLNDEAVHWPTLTLSHCHPSTCTPLIMNKGVFWSYKCKPDEEIMALFLLNV